MRARRAPLLAAAAGVVVAGLLSFASTQAALSARTSTASSFSAGAVTISDDTQGSALVAVTGLLPGAVVTRCVDVTYTGNLPSQVRLYLTGASGGLGRDLEVRVEVGSGGGFAGCTGFAPITTTYWGSAADLAATRTGWASGLAAFDPGPGPVNATYRFTFSLRADAASSSQGANVAANYVWEARSVSAPNGLGLVALPGGCASWAGAHGCTTATGLAYPWEVAVSPDGANVYAATGEWANALVALARDPATGTLSVLPGGAGCLTHDVVAGCTQVRGLDYAHAVAVSPDGRNVYVSSETDRTIGVYSRDATTGALTQLAGTAGCVNQSGAYGCAILANLDMPRQMVLSPDGRTLYLQTNGSNLFIFQRDASTGVLTPASCLSSGGGGGCTGEPRLQWSSAITVSPDGATVYTGSVLALARDPSTGALTPLAGTSGCVKGWAQSGCTFDPAIASGGEGVGVTPDGTQLLVAARDDHTLAVYGRDRTTGAVGARQQCFNPTGANGCTAVPTLVSPWTVVASRDGSAVYVSMTGANRGVLGFDRDVTTGELTPHPGTGGCITSDGTGGACTATDTLWDNRHLAESPDGRHLYVGNFAGNWGVTVLTR